MNRLVILFERKGETFGAEWTGNDVGLRQGEATGVSEAMAVLAQRPRVDPRRSAVVVVDMISWQVTPDAGLLERMAADGVSIDDIVDRVRNTVLPNTVRLIEKARLTGATIVGYVVADATATFSQRLQDSTEEILGACMAEIVSTRDSIERLAIHASVA